MQPEEQAPFGSTPKLVEDSDSRWWDAAQVAAFLKVRVVDLPRLLGRRRIPRPSYHLGYASPRWDRGEMETLRKQGRIRV